MKLHELIKELQRLQAEHHEDMDVVIGVHQYTHLPLNLDGTAIHGDSDTIFLIGHH